MIIKVTFLWKNATDVSRKILLLLSQFMMQCIYIKGYFRISIFPLGNTLMFFSFALTPIYIRKVMNTSIGKTGFLQFQVKKKLQLFQKSNFQIIPSGVC